MGESNVEAASVISDIVRTIFSVLDRPAYWLLGIMYQLFFNVASADLFSNDTVMKFYGRVQLILGVFMMFKLALIILRGIVEPEGFFGGKKGDSSAGSFITKVITGLVILTLMMPISIPGARNEYEIQINNNGLLFGTLYSLQHRLLANNTLGRFILGNDDMAEDYTSDTDELKKSARIFTSSILKGFYRINLLPEDERPKHEEGKDDAVFNDNRVCKDIDDDVLKAYTRLDADPGEIIGMVNLTCEGDSKSGGAFNSLLGVISPKLAGKTYYVFSYMPFISMIVPLVFVFILLSFTIDVAVRAVKLAVLRLIAPIPIISYMDPKGSKDSAFNTWVKTLTSTYLDLFIRLAAVYFAIFLIQDMIKNGIVINRGDGVIGIISLILIWIGIFIFAKQAPKFIKEVLGLKGDPGKLFGGLTDALALGAAAGGIIGSAATSYRAAKEENDELHEGSSFNGLRNFGSAISGAIGGGITGAKAFSNKDASWNSVLQAHAKHNAQRAGHATFGGRVSGDIYGMMTGRSLATRDQSVYDTANKAFDSLKKLKSVSEDEALKQTDYYGEYKGNGHSYNYQTLSAALQRARSSGQDTFNVQDSTGVVTTLRTDEMNEIVMNDIKASQAASYLKDQTNGLGALDHSTGTRKAFVRNGTLLNQHANTERAVKVAGFDKAGSYTDPKTKVTTHYDAYDGTDYKSVKKTMGRAADITTGSDTSMRTIKNRANNTKSN